MFKRNEEKLNLIEICQVHPLFQDIFMFVNKDNKEFETIFNFSSPFSFDQVVNGSMNYAFNECLYRRNIIRNKCILKCFKCCLNSLLSKTVY